MLEILLERVTSMKHQSNNLELSMKISVSVFYIHLFSWFASHSNIKENTHTQIINFDYCDGSISYSGWANTNPNTLLIKLK